MTMQRYHITHVNYVQQIFVCLLNTDLEKFGSIQNYFFLSKFKLEKLTKQNFFKGILVTDKPIENTVNSFFRAVLSFDQN